MTPHDRDPELEFHVEMLTRRYIGDGLAPEAAREKALARMGDLDAAATHRDRAAGGRARGWRTWGQDARHAARGLRRSWAFVALAVLMLSLGTGASVAMFSITDSVILRSPFADADAMALVHVRTPEGRKHSGVPRTAYDTLQQSPPAAILAIGLLTVASPIVTRVDVPRRTQTECVSASMADVVGTRPIMGRWFGPGEDRPGATPVAVVSAAFWEGSLARDPGVIGRVIALDDEPVTIVGVMPRGFEGPLTRQSRDLWLPLGLSTADRPRFGCRLGATVSASVRLAPGVTVTDGTAALNLAAGTTDLVLTPVKEAVTADIRGPFAALLGAVLAVMLIVIANVANLGLERQLARRRDMRVQLALGATRGRLIRQTVIEHLLVAAAGAALGLLVAAASLDVIVAMLPPSFPNLADVTVNGRVLAASLGLTFVGALASGALSAWQTTRLKSGLTLADRGSVRGTSRTRHALIAVELALGVLLMIGALLMVRTFLTLRPAAPGFDAEDKHLAAVRLSREIPAGERMQLTRDIRIALAGIPGVHDVAATTYVPMSREVSLLEASIGGRRAAVYTGAVTANYFDLLSIPLRRGRHFQAGDHASAPPVAIVNEAFVRRWLDTGEPLGATVTLDVATVTAPVTIVGVIGDTRSFGSDTRARPELYMPIPQLDLGSPTFVIHATSAATPGLEATVRRLVDRERPGQLVDRFTSYPAFLDAETARPWLGAWLFSAFAGLAVLLGAIGLAATMAWSVTQRHREIGIRLALGATPRQVRRLVVGQGAVVTMAGIGLGVIAAVLSTHLLSNWLYGVNALDPGTFVAAGTAMAIVALIASWWPARRASAIDPALTLRGDAS